MCLAKGKHCESLGMVVVVTISETRPCRGNEVSTKVFADMEKACGWIESQIEAIVSEYELDCERDVDGWLVKLDGYDHTIQYDAVEQSVIC